MRTTREIEREKNKAVFIFAIIFAVGISLCIDFLFFSASQPVGHLETRSLDVGCAMGGYPTHSNMLCESGVEGDIRNEYNGIIWYCGGGTKKCIWKEMVYDK